MSAERIGIPDTCINCGKVHQPGHCEGEQFNGNALAGLLVRHGIIDPSAVDDPEGYDGGATMLRVRTAAQELNHDPVLCRSDLLADAIRLLKSAPLEQYARWKKHSVADKSGRKCMDQVVAWSNERARWLERTKSRVLLACPTCGIQPETRQWHTYCPHCGREAEFGETPEKCEANWNKMIASESVDGPTAGQCDEILGRTHYASVRHHPRPAINDGPTTHPWWCEGCGWWVAPEAVTRHGRHDERCCGCGGKCV